jgi:hypothetical protein
MYAQKTTTADIPILTAIILSYINKSLLLIFTVLSLSRSTFEHSCHLHTSDIHALLRALAVFSLLWLSHYFIASLIKMSLLE